MDVVDKGKCNESCYEETSTVKQHPSPNSTTINAKHAWG